MRAVPVNAGQHTDHSAWHSIRVSWPKLVRVYWAITAGMLVLALWMALFYAPVHDQMGLVQKLVYVHIPAAAAAMVASGCVFVGSVAYLWTRASLWDRVSAEGIRVVVLSSAIVLVTGAIWGKSYWGSWWTWSPRLTFTLILCALYTGLFMMRWWLRPRSKQATVSSVCGAVAFLDTPLLYLSVRLLPDVHPTSIPLTTEMQLTLAAWFVVVTLVSVGIVASPVVRYFQLRERLASHA